MQRVALAISVVMGLLFAMHGWAAADDFFASSPGPLAESHAAIDTKDRCNDCHVDGSREVADQKCLGCHDHQDLAGRINAGKGFHASAAVKGKPCKTCPSDHQKPSFELMGRTAVTGRATSTARAPNASACSTSKPRRMPPSTSTGTCRPTAPTIGATASSGAGCPGAAGRPEVETTRPGAPG